MMLVCSLISLTHTVFAICFVFAPKHFNKVLKNRQKSLKVDKNAASLPTPLQLANFQINIILLKQD